MKNRMPDNGSYTGIVDVQIDSWIAREVLASLTIDRNETMNEIKAPGMYIFVNQSLHMSAGKIAAQAAHAAIEAYRISDKDMINAWYLGQHYAKYIMLAKDTQTLYAIQKYIEARGFKTMLIIDEGMTEIDPHQPTALGVEVVDRDDLHTKATFSTFKLYRDEIRFEVKVDR